MAYNFELPRFTDLTSHQRLALDEKNAIALSGGPGTGKTVVSLWRHIRNYELNNIKSLLLTYTKTLEFYLKQTARIKDYNASEYIDRTLRWTSNPTGNFDEIIIDEAQDVECERYDVIKNHTDLVSYGADEAQSVYYHNCSTIDELRGLFFNNKEYELANNFRNSKEILLFTKSVFPEFYIPHNVVESAPLKERKPYVQELGWDNFEGKVIDEIIEITEDFSDETHNIGILLPSKAQVDKYYESLELKTTCSKYHNKMPNFEKLGRIHITTYKSAKGLEFDTVILPNFDNYNYFIDNYDNFSENDYYVALTRAKLNLYLLCRNALNIGDSKTYNTERSGNANNYSNNEDVTDDLPF